MPPAQMQVSQCNKYSLYHVSKILRILNSETHLASWSFGDGCLFYCMDSYGNGGWLYCCYNPNHSVCVVEASL